MILLERGSIFGYFKESFIIHRKALEEVKESGRRKERKRSNKVKSKGSLIFFLIRFFQIHFNF